MLHSDGTGGRLLRNHGGRALRLLAAASVAAAALVVDGPVRTSVAQELNGARLQAGGAASLVQVGIREAQRLQAPPPPGGPPWMQPGGEGGPFGPPGGRPPAAKKKKPKPAPARPPTTQKSETEYPMRVIMKDGRRLYANVKDDGDGYLIIKVAQTFRVLKAEVDHIEDVKTGATTKPTSRPASRPSRSNTMYRR